MTTADPQQSPEATAVAQSGPQSTQPAMNTSAITASATILVNGVMIFGLVSFTSEQKLYLVSAIAFFAPLVAGYFIRGKVFSGATVQRLTAGLIADRTRAQTQLLAAQEAATAIQKSLPGVVRAAAGIAPQRPSERQEMPVMQTEPETNVDTAAPRRRPRRADPTRQAFDPAPRYEPEQTAQPQGYYDYSDNPDAWAPRNPRQGTRHGLRSDRRTPPES